MNISQNLQVDQIPQTSRQGPREVISRHNSSKGKYRSIIGNEDLSYIEVTSDDEQMMPYHLLGEQGSVVVSHLYLHDVGP